MCDRRCGVQARRLSILATTSLTCFASPDPTAAAEPIKLSLGGYAVSGLTVRAQDNVADAVPGPVNRGANDDRGYASTTDLGRTDQFWEAEVYLVGETTLDNGIKVGVNIELVFYASNNQFDENYVYVSGGFGRLVAGARNSAAYTMHFVAPSPSAEFTVDEDRNLSPFRAPSAHAAGGTVTTLTQLTSNANKITYYTPQFAPGFQFGFSYTPDDDAPQGVQTVNGAGDCRNGCAFDAGNGISDTRQPNHHHFIEAAAGFSRSLDGVELGFDVGFGYGFLERQSRSGANDRLGKDRIVLGAGFNVAFAGWTIGAAAAWDNNGLQGPNSRYDVTFGATYGSGPWLVGFDVGYAIAKDGQALQGAPAGPASPTLVRRSNDTLLYSEVGGSYQLGPGIKLFSVVNVARWTGNGTPTEESTGVALSTGFQLTF